MAVSFCGQAVALRAERTGGLVMHRQEFLRLAQGLESPLVFSHRFVCRSGKPARWRRRKCNPMTRSHLPRLVPAFHEFADETQRRSFVASRLDQDIKHISIGIHDPPKPMAPAFDPDHDFIKMQLVGRLRSVSLGLAHDLMAKPVHPIPDRLVRNADAAFRQEFINVALAQGKPMVNPYGAANDASAT